MSKSPRKHVFKLTKRELVVLQLMTQALSNREISEQLGVGVEAVRMHAKNIYAKLGVKGRHQASLKALDLGLVQSPQASQETIPTNLLSNREKFIGRAKELDDLFQIFQRGEQLITILGSGGMGKTHLASEYAYRHLTDYSDGVFFISLESLESVDSIILQFIEELAIPVTSKTSYEQQVLDYLSDKQLLLVVDNWEHLLDGVIILSKIVNTAPEVHIIATSREILSLRQAVTYRLQGLAIPSLDDLDNSLKYDSVQFLQQAIQRHRYDWTVTEDNIVATIKLCQLTGGMPLAILLASAWISVYSLEQILEEITKNINFLSTDLRDLPQRHRSIYDVFEWSWGLLTAEKRETFIRMSVFRNGCTLEAAVNITDASPQTLQVLINKSLVQRSSTGRYLIHELLRQFGELKLKEAPEIEAETRDSHALYYADISERIMANQLIGKAATVEFDNLYVAWHWAVDTRKSAILRRFVTTFGLISYQLNNYIEVKRLFNYALESPFLYEIDQSYLLGSLKFASSAILQQPLNLARNRQLIKEGEEIFEGADWAQLNTEVVYTFYYWALGYRLIDYTKSVFILEKLIPSLESHQESEDIVLVTMLAYCYSQLCHIYYVFASELEKAKTYGIQSLQMARNIPHKTLIALNASFLGHIEFMLGNLEQATHYFRESIKIYQDLNSTFDFGNCLQYAGENALVLANYDEARDYLKRSLDLLNGYGAINGMLTLCCIVALWKYKEEDYIGATELVTYSQHNDDHIGRVNVVIGRIWGEFNPPIDAKDYQLATERGQLMDYDTVVRDLYAWLE